MNRARTLMLQGTASSVGKTLLVAALGRVLARQGVRVAPFKAQNMALNAHVTHDGLEMGRAQALQARACRVLPEVDMNPILIKPQADMVAQVVVMGRSSGVSSAARYHDDKLALRDVVVATLDRLRARFDVVLIEGAGSPAEINLRARDLVNMFVAHAADAPVLLVGDIDRGGVFAHLIGTLALLEPPDRARVAGFLINKFRGDPALLQSGLDELEVRAGLPVFGVIPHVPDLRLAGEDSLSVAARVTTRHALPGELEIAIVMVPFGANLDDFDAFAWEQGVVVRHVRHPDDLGDPDLVILPGSKATLSDLAWLRERGFEAALRARARRGGAILGVCGGCQMLGEQIVDDEGVEASPGTRAPGLGLLPIETRFESHKRTRRVAARGEAQRSPLGAFDAADGYWIHAGRVRARPGSAAVEARVDDGNGQPGPWEPDGAIGGEEAPAAFGTMIHGLFENDRPRRNLLAFLGARRGLAWAPGPAVPSLDRELDRLADAFEAAVDMKAVARLLER